jgi:microcystin degradation protein MlrC
VAVKRIVVAGYWHESSGDAAALAGPVGLEHFAVLEGARLLDFLGAAGLGVGLLSACADHGIDVIPGPFAMGSPSATADGDVYATLRPRILTSVEAALPVDGVFLYLHGAAATTTVDDVDGDLAAAVRTLVGADTPIVTALDLHALVTPTMAAAIDVMLGCRTYPHVDLAARAAAAMELMGGLWDGYRPVTQLELIPVSLPMKATDLYPMPALAQCAREQ